MLFIRKLISFRILVFLFSLLFVSYLGYRAIFIDIDFSTRSLYLSDDPELDFLAKHQKVFGNDDGLIILALKSDKIFTPAFMKMVDNLTKSISEITIKRGKLKVDTDKKEQSRLRVINNADDVFNIMNTTVLKNSNSVDKDNFQEEEIIEDEEEIIDDSLEKNNNSIELSENKDLSENLPSKKNENSDKIQFDSYKAPIGSTIKPVEYVISLTNTQHIYGKETDDKNVVDLIIEPFISQTELDSFKKDDYSDLPNLRDSVLKSNLLKKQLLSEDGKTTAIILKMDNILTTEGERRPVIQKVMKIFKNYKKENSEIFKNLNIQYGFSGIPIVQGEYSRLIGSDLFFFFFLSAIVMGVVLLYLFKKPHGIFLPLTIVSLAAVATFGIMAMSGESLNIVNNIIPTLILVIGLSDTIHILHRYHFEINENGLEKQQAIEITFFDLFKACFITSFTTAIGFFSLLSAKIDIIKRLGLYSGIGILLAFMFIMLLLPGILYMIKKPIFKKRKEGINLDKLLLKIHEINIKHPWRNLFIAILILSIAIYFITKMDINTHMLEELKENNPIRQGIMFVEKNMTGVLPIEISIESKTGEKNSILRVDVLKAMDELKKELRKNSSIGFIVTISDYIKESYWAANGSIERYLTIPDSKDLILNYYGRLKDSEKGERDIGNIVSTNGDKLKFSFAQTDVGLNQFFITVDKLKKDIDKLFPKDVEVKITGGTFVAFRALNNIIHDMILSLGLAFIFIALTMIIMLRSIKLGLLSMIPNMMPILYTMGVMGGFGIIVRTSTVLIFSIALGIAVDDSIHFLARYKIEGEKHKNNIDALKYTMLGTGKAIIFTSVLIIIGVMVLLFSDFIAIIHYSILTMVVMFAALLGVLFVLPPLLMIVNPLKLK
ncbi:MMPL family transporter [bacterium]|nr:MMPL family transporter [bacterium]